MDNRFETIQNELKNEYLSFYFRPLRKDAPFIGDLPVEAIPDFSQRMPIAWSEVWMLYLNIRLLLIFKIKWLLSKAQRRCVNTHLHFLFKIHSGS